MPAVGAELIEARQKSFGAVAPPLRVTVCACHARGFWRESRPSTGWIVVTNALLVARSTQAKPTTGFDLMNAFAWRGMAAFVVTASLAALLFCETALNETTLRKSGPDVDAVAIPSAIAAQPSAVMAESAKILRISPFRSVLWT